MNYQHLSHNERYQQYEQPTQQQVAERLLYESNKQTMSNVSNLPYNPGTRYSSATGPSPFQRNNHIYWTLQHRRQSPSVNSVLPKDDSNVAIVKEGLNVNDLYATPNKVRNREGLKTTPLGFSTFFSPIKADSVESGISPIDPHNAAGFKTSTPSKAESPSKGSLADELRYRLHIQDGTRSYNASPSSSGRSTPLRGLIEQQQPRLRHSWAPETPEPSKTCSDRLGNQKTSLMDFKKLLLAKSSKTISTGKKSAVEQLKLNKKDATEAPPGQPAQVLNTSMNILELSGSPKTFANRRNIRQGNFGSPSKTLGPKQRGNWRLNASRTDVMSTAIPEAHSEEDASSSNSSNGSIGRRSPNVNKIGSSISPSPLVTSEKNVIDDKINLKTNIFLQAEENNFMKGEMKNSCGITRSQLAQARAQFLMGTKGLQSENKERMTDIYKKSIYDTANTNILTGTPNFPTVASRREAIESQTTDDSNNAVAAPSLETAL
ncbi:unnamed protein product [Hermetia illucens]|uniref:WASP family protein member n=1 Tax=Hermetia illucens TaxID=343691 RepID=A0A7R8YT94_HERIL|nr:unnamed protein product [Hermetia illucens]